MPHKFHHQLATHIDKRDKNLSVNKDSYQHECKCKLLPNKTKIHTLSNQGKIHSEWNVCLQGILSIFTPLSVFFKQTGQTVPKKKQLFQPTKKQY